MVKLVQLVTHWCHRIYGVLRHYRDTYHDTYHDNGVSKQNVSEETDDTDPSHTKTPQRGDAALMSPFSLAFLNSTRQNRIIRPSRYRSQCSSLASRICPKHRQLTQGRFPPTEPISTDTNTTNAARFWGHFGGSIANIRATLLQ
jgi:hypothetical protein